MKITLSKLAEYLSATLVGDPNLEIVNVAPLEKAQSHELSFLVGGQYKKFLKTTKAAAVILSPNFSSEYSGNALIVDNPELAFARVLKGFFEIKKLHKPGIHPTAYVGENSVVHPSASVGPHVVLGENTRIAANVCILAGAVLGDNVSIAEGVLIKSNVTISDRTEIGANSIIYAGAVIGSDGFGYVNHQETWEKIPQIGRVIIGKDVEIGANAAIDIGAIQNTVIRDGVKIDNLVQIGHNVEIGEHTIIAGCTVIAGSVKLGKHCMVGGLLL